MPFPLFVLNKGVVSVKNIGLHEKTGYEFDHTRFPYHFRKTYFTEATRLLKEAGSFMARSARIFLSTLMPFTLSLLMNSE